MTKQETERGPRWIPVLALTAIIFAILFCLVTAAAEAGHGNYQSAEWYFTGGVILTMVGGFILAIIPDSLSETTEGNTDAQ